jgi:NRPS condensation-like uncharacterized protein
MAENQNKLMPDDQLQWRAWLLPNLETGESALVLKVHHCIGDGLAILILFSTLVDSYKPDLWIQTTKPLSKCAKIVITLLKPFTLIYAFLFFLFWGIDKNFIKDNVKLTGKKRNAISKKFDVQKLKKLGKSYGATLNDVVLALVGMSIK